jgi:putative membrane protein
MKHVLQVGTTGRRRLLRADRLCHHRPMTREAILAYVHLLAILTMVVFLVAEAVLCRGEWLNAAVVQRLGRVDLIYGLAAVAVLATGFLRTWLGVKGMDWYWHNPLLHVKVTLFVIVGLLSIKPTLMFIRWRKVLAADGSLPDATQIKTARRYVMIQAHILPFIPLAATFLARGFGAR